MSRGAGVSRLDYELMHSAFRELPGVSKRSAGGLADALSHLLKLAMLEKCGRPTDLTHRELLRNRIKQYVQTHLRDPDLSIHASRSKRHAPITSDQPK